METLWSLSLISLDLKAFAPDFLPDSTSSIIIRVKCSLECHIRFCYDVSSLRATLCPIHIYMPHNALNTVEIQYIFMDQANGPVLCGANTESGNRKYFTPCSSKLFILWIWHLQQCKWLRLISAKIDRSIGWCHLSCHVARWFEEVSSQRRRGSSSVWRGFFTKSVASDRHYCVFLPDKSSFLPAKVMWPVVWVAVGGGGTLRNVARQKLLSDQP